jgi:serine protease Do
MEIQPQLKHTEPRVGLLVSGVVADTPAQRSGLQSGDILLELAGAPVDVRFSEQIPRFNSLVASLPIGETAEMVVLREDNRKNLEIVPVEREEARPRTTEVKEWGITVRDLSFLAAKEMKREDRDGVLVTSVRPGGPCGEAKPALQSLDVIVEVSGTPIANVKDLERMTEDLLGGVDKTVPALTVFERKTKQYLTVVEVGVKELRDPGLEVKKAWLPVDTQVLTRDLAKQLGVPEQKGVRITQVYSHEDVEKTGLEVGDILIAIDGEKIEASEQEDYEVFPTLIRQYKVGSEVELTLLRDGEVQKVKVELVRSPQLVREMRKYEDKNFEFTARDVAFLDKASEGWDEAQEGVLVSEVVPGGWAALGNLAVSDLILEIDGVSIADIDSIKERMREIADRKPDSLVFLVLRGIHRVYLEFEPAWEDEES